MLLAQVDLPRGGIGETSFGIAVALVIVGAVLMILRELRAPKQNTDDFVRAELASLQGVVSEMQQSIADLLATVDNGILPRLNDYKENLKEISQRLLTVERRS